MLQVTFTEKKNYKMLTNVFYISVVYTSKKKN